MSFCSFGRQFDFELRLWGLQPDPEQQERINLVRWHQYCLQYCENLCISRFAVPQKLALRNVVCTAVALSSSPQRLL